MANPAATPTEAFAIMAVYLLVLAGPPCSGKSTLGGLIETEFGIRRLQVDAILSDLIPDSQRNRADRDLAYRAMHMLAKELLACGHAVTVDATYGNGRHRAAVETLVGSLGVPLYLAECHVAPGTAVDRFKNRLNHPALDLSEQRVRDLAERYPYSQQGLTVNEDTPSHAALKEIKAYLLRRISLHVDGRWSSSSIDYVS